MKQNRVFNTLKQTALAVMLSGSLLAVPHVSASGIPVFDGAAVAKAAEQIINMKTQIDNQLKQLSELKSQVQAISGTRNMGQILNGVKSQLPDEWQRLYGSMTATNYKDLLKGKNYTPEQAAKDLFANYDATLKSFEDTKKRLNNIQALMSRINTTQDLKASADLQSRIAAEQAVIQNNQTKLDMMTKLFELQSRIAARQQVQHERCILSKRSNLHLNGCD